MNDCFGWNLNGDWNLKVVWMVWAINFHGMCYFSKDVYLMWHQHMLYSRSCINRVFRGCTSSETLHTITNDIEDEIFFLLNATKLANKADLPKLSVNANIYWHLNCVDLFISINNVSFAIWSMNIISYLNTIWGTIFWKKSMIFTSWEILIARSIVYTSLPLLLP